MANYPAALAGRRVSPIDDLNLNRIFPGDPNGSVTQQIAYFIDSELIPRADFVMDLHSGGSSLMYVPCAPAEQAPTPELFARQLAALRAFGAPYTYVQGGAQGQGGDQTLGERRAQKRGIVALGAELGGSGTVTPAGLAITERGVRNVLVHLGILPAEDAVPVPETHFLDVRGPEMYLYAPENGVFEPLVVELGDRVSPGTPAARIHFPESPWTPPVELSFKAAGIVLCKRIPARTMRGDCLFHLASDLKL